MRVMTLGDGEKRCISVDYVESGLCVDNTNAAIGERCNSGSDKDKGKKLWDSLESKYMAEDSSNICLWSQLGSHLRIEESLRAHDSDKGKGKEVGGPSVNMTEEGKNKHNKQNKGKRRSNENNSGSSSNKKPKLECWKCGKTGHFKRDCRSGKKNNANAGGSGKGSKDQSQDQGLMQLAWWIRSLERTNSMIVKIVVGLRLSNQWKTDLYFTWVMNTCILFMGKGSVALEFKSRDAIFDENRFSSIPRPKDIIPNVQESQMDDHTDLYLVEGSRDQVGSQYSYCFSIEEDPRTYNEAMQSRDAAFWKEAIDDEIGSIMENNTWVLSDLPPGCKPLDKRREFDYFDTYHQLLHFLNGDLEKRRVYEATEKDLLCLISLNTQELWLFDVCYDNTRPDIAYVFGRLSRWQERKDYLCNMTLAASEAVLTYSYVHQWIWDQWLEKPLEASTHLSGEDLVGGFRKAFELMKKQEEMRETQQMEFSAKLVEFKAMQAYARNCIFGLCCRRCGDYKIVQFGRLMGMYSGLNWGLRWGLKWAWDYEQKWELRWVYLGAKIVNEVGAFGAEVGLKLTENPGNFAKHWRKLLLGQSCITMMVLRLS
ncbi:zinc finger, CCHC-type containing protein [Tanacetum coccineum]